MEDFDMPLFDIKMTSSHILVSGGGGNKDYGVDNGIIAVHKETTKKMHFKTEDIIVRMDMAKYENGSYLIAACGSEYFYMIKFDGKFEEKCKIHKKVKKAIVTNNLYVLDKNKTVYGFSNIMENQEITITWKETKKIDYSNYVYASTEKGNQIQFHPEDKENTKDSFMAIGNVSNIFVSEGMLRVVRYEEKQSTFVVDGITEKVDGKIGEIIDQNGNLIYYAHRPEGSLLSINGTEKMLPKITDIDISGEYLVLSTVYGDIHVFMKGEELHRRNVANMAITGVAVYNQNIKFTMFTGVLGTTSLNKSRKMRMGLIMLLMLLMAIVLGIYMRKQKK